VAGEGAVAEMAGRVRPPGDLDVQRLNGALTSYSWLMECESRQGHFTHGPYDTGRGTSLLVREFGDLSGSAYPWVTPEASVEARGRVAIVLELRDVRPEFDVFGTVRLIPETYGPNVAGVAVATEAGYEPDPVAWLTDLGQQVRRAHPRLYRIVAGWSARERFAGGARSYARLWSALVDAAGGTPEDHRRLVLAPLDEAIDTRMDRLIEAEGEPPVWEWARRADRPTIFAPLIGGAGERS
jgi:hypothetical protein